MEKLRALVIAGGGTGGHLFPGLAVAEEFRRRSGEIRILYIGVAGKLEERVIPAAGLDFYGLRVKGLKGEGPLKQAAGVLLAARAALRCRSLLAAFGPDLVIGVGGYSSGPAGLAAWSLGLPLVLQEQNTVPGLTNRLLGRLARKVFVAFDEASSFFPEGRAVLTGNPVRGDALGAEREVCGSGKPRLLVLGGSRGARGMNRLVMSALRLLGEKARDIDFIHQAGEEDREEVERAYRELGIEAQVKAFIEHMGNAYSWSDLIVSRAGAGAISEIAANGRPALLVPFPHAAGDHQRKNARWLVEAGGALTVDEGGAEGAREMADLLGDLMRKNGRIREMAAKSRSAGKRDAASRIVSECYEMLGATRG